MKINRHVDQYIFFEALKTEIKRKVIEKDNEKRNIK